MTLKQTCFLISFIFICLNASNAWALLYEIDYDRTFTAEEISMWTYAGPIFGVSEGPAAVHVSLILDTEAAAVDYYPAGFYINDYTETSNDLFFYDPAAIRTLTATFGIKTWDLDDLYVGYGGDIFGYVSFFMDALPLDGGTANLGLRVEDADGSFELDWLYYHIGGLGMIQDGRVIISDVSSAPFMGGAGGVVSIHEVAPVPEPATLLLLASGLIGLAGFKNKFKS